MSPKKYGSADDFLKDPNGDINKLRKMGITDFAVITYVVRVLEGKSQEEALRGLLLGRSLTPDQIEFVRKVLVTFPLRRSAEAGYLALEPALIEALDFICDPDKIFFGGLLLLVSPLVTWSFLAPPAILYAMLFGLACAIAGLRTGLAQAD